MQNLITDHLETWTTAKVQKASGGRGRKSGNGESQYGIQKLRELILDLAIRGKLVPQDPNDEPASVLIKKIFEEKSRLIAEGKIQKKKPLPSIEEEEKSFELPDGWVLSRFGEVFELEYGDNLPQGKRTNSGEYPVYGSNGIVGTHDKYCVEKPCIVIGRKGSAGALNLCHQQRCWVTDVAFSTVPPSDMDLEFTFRLFQTLGLDRLGKGIKPGLNRNEAYVLSVAIPPLAEQRRIVAKVDELMALCDQLEQEQADNSETHLLLVKTLLDTLTSTTDHEDFISSWQRIEENFDILFTTPESIDELKQTILQLAVMGKLVPQDPNDEPASVLLEKIAKEKAKLVEAGKIKKQKSLPEISEDEKQFPVPNGWRIVRFTEIVQEVSTGPFGTMIHKQEYIDGGVPLINPSHMINGKIKEDQSISVNKTKAEELSAYKIFEGDILLARRGELGRSALVTKNEHGWLCGTGSFRLRFNREVSRAYILLLFSTHQVRRYLRGASVGATMTNLNHTILSKLPLVLPPAAEQDRIVAKVDKLLAICDSLAEVSRTAHATQVRIADEIVRVGLTS